MPYKVLLTFKPVDYILKYDDSNSRNHFKLAANNNHYFFKGELEKRYFQLIVISAIIVSQRDQYGIYHALDRSVICRAASKDRFPIS